MLTQIKQKYWDDMYIFYELPVLTWGYGAIHICCQLQNSSPNPYASVTQSLQRSRQGQVKASNKFTHLGK